MRCGHSVAAGGLTRLAKLNSRAPMIEPLAYRQNNCFRCYIDAGVGGGRCTIAQRRAAVDARLGTH